MKIGVEHKGTALCTNMMSEDRYLKQAASPIGVLNRGYFISISSFSILGRANESFSESIFSIR